MKPIFIVFAIFSCMSCSVYQRHLYVAPQPHILDSIMQSPQLQSFDAVKKARNIQIIYTQVHRDKNNHPHFTDYHYNVNDSNYFYPASTVKMPVAFLALEYLNTLKHLTVNAQTPMLTDSSFKGQQQVLNDAFSTNGTPTVANYIKEIFLVSDNDAYNRLYELLGQQYIQEKLTAKGYPNAVIRHRLSVAMTDEQNRHTNAIRFVDTSGRILFEKPAAYSNAVFPEQPVALGKGYMRGNKLVNEPFPFTTKNRVSLADLHQMLRSVMFPSAVPAKQRFNLNDSDYALLYKWMRSYPQSGNYNPKEQWDTYCKFLYYGSEKVIPNPNLHIFNKVGNAYGFLIDVAYFVDTEHHIEFMLSATISCNSDGIYNDDRYEYETVGFPFMKQLGQAIYNYEKAHPKKVQPSFKMLMIP